jgi:hypothetical protein
MGIKNEGLRRPSLFPDLGQNECLSHLKKNLQEPSEINTGLLYPEKFLSSFAFNNLHFPWREVVEGIDEVVDFGFELGDGGAVGIGQYFLDELDDRGLLFFRCRENGYSPHIHGFIFQETARTGSSLKADPPFAQR